MRTALGVIAGFVAWSVLWLCFNFALRSAGLLPADGTQPVAALAPLLTLLALSVVASIVSGFLAVRIAGTPLAALVLGVLLLLVGIAVEMRYWTLTPSWYSIAFLVLLYPATVLGGRMSRTRRPRLARA